MPFDQSSITIDDITKPYFVLFEDNYTHDNELHSHQKGQLVYVESGFQYLTVEGNIYLLPQNHAAWIPSGYIHKTNSHSEKIKLMVMFFDVDKDEAFYNKVNVFLVPPVL
ncbi:AraC family ligand binding domain-containing protein, partial [Elizabethkingia meningoseptica]